MINWEAGMLKTVQLATARELAAAGSVFDTLLVGQAGGYAVMFKLGIGERALATKAGATRLFAGLDAAVRVLRRELGINRYRVDASGFSEREEPRRRPDRTAALKQSHEDAAYAEFLREGAAKALADTRAPLSSADAKAHMNDIKARHLAQLDEMMRRKDRKR